jgi:glutamine synthetase
MILAAGLEGIAEGLDPGDPHTENMYNYSLADLQAMEIDMLPAPCKRRSTPLRPTRSAGW